MKPHKSLFLSGAILLSQLGVTCPAEVKSAPTSETPPSRWELQIVNSALLRPNATHIPATLQNVVDYLVELRPANVVLAPTLGGIQIENLKLAGFRWESALEALRIASGNQFRWSAQGATSEIDPTTGMPLPPVARDETTLYVLEPDPMGSRRPGDREVEVFNLAGYLEGKFPAQVTETLNEVQAILGESLEQVRAGSNLPESEPVPSIRFHASANLLVVVGTARQMEVARKIILALPRTASSQAAGAGMGYGGAGTGGSGFGGGAGMMGGMNEAMMRRYGLLPQNPPPGTAAGAASVSPLLPSSNPPESPALAQPVPTKEP